MIGSPGCGHKEHRSWWRVTDREQNHSAFNGYRRTPSDYSQVRCFAPNCNHIWRTKAAYVDNIPDAPRDWWKDPAEVTRSIGEGTLAGIR